MRLGLNMIGCPPWAALCLACSSASEPVDTSATGASRGPAGSEESSSTAADTTDTGAGSEASSDGSTSAGDETSDGFKFDTPAGGTDTEGLECWCHDEFSYIWIANSGESTVSKINTRTMEEEGRYLTRPDGAGNPSRTSVSIDGRAVVVANRHGGITKIWANQVDCEDQNGVPGIQTSTGKNDVSAWGDDDCVAWHQPFASLSTQRPVQWTPGQLDRETCEYTDQKVWTVGGMGGTPGQCAADGVWAYRLNGDTGEIEDTVHLPETEFPCAADPFSPYGATVDLDDNLWFISRAMARLARVDAETLETSVYAAPFGPYGITADDKGRIWLAAGTGGHKTARFDGVAELWAWTPTGNYGGIQQGPDGRIWVANNSPAKVVAIDPDTMEIGQELFPPALGLLKGVSVDIDGYVWAIHRDSDTAFKIDPATEEIESYVGLTSAYTYSDMTGGAIQNITCMPAD